MIILLIIVILLLYLRKGREGHHIYPNQSAQWKNRKRQSQQVPTFREAIIAVIIISKLEHNKVESMIT